MKLTAGGGCGVVVATAKSRGEGEESSVSHVINANEAPNERDMLHW